MSVSTTISNQSSTMPPRLFSATEASDNQYMVNLNNNQNEKQPVQWGEYPQYKLIPFPSYNMSNPGVNNCIKVNSYPSASEEMTYNPPNYFEATCDRHVTNIPNHNNMIIGNPQNGRNVPNLMTSAGVRNGSGSHITATNSWINPMRSAERYTRPATWSSNNKPSSCGVRKPKRIRTAFTSQQMMELEQEYSKSRYLDRSRRIELSDILQLNERTIKIWFQNRRMKEKKDRAEGLEDSEASTTESSPDMGSGNVVHMCEQYPSTPSINTMVNRPNIYVDHYTNAAPAIMLPQSCVPISEAAHNMFVNTYPAYVYDNSHHNIVQMEPHTRAPEFQAANSIATLEPVAENKETVLPDSSTNTVEPTGETLDNEIYEQKWDFSWLRSVKIEEEF